LEDTQQIHGQWLQAASNFVEPASDPCLAPLQAEKLHKKCVMLEKNLSCLYRTAWTHVLRKEGHIVTLKEQLRDLRRATALIDAGGAQETASDQPDGCERAAELCCPRDISFALLHTTRRYLPGE
jgi:hypothetical protein